MCEAFTAGMTDIHAKHPKPADEAPLLEKMQYINFIERASGKLVKQLHKSYGIGKTRGSHKDGWSPAFTAHKAHLEALTEIKRIVMGYRRHPKRSTVDDMQRDVPHIIGVWDWELTSPDLSEDQVKIWNCAQGRDDNGG